MAHPTYFYRVSYFKPPSSTPLPGYDDGVNPDTMDDPRERFQVEVFQLVVIDCMMAASAASLAIARSRCMPCASYGITV